MNEQDLIEKLRRVEALHRGGATAGERAAAAEAMARLQARLETFEQEDPAREVRFSLENRWSRALFLALLRRHGLKPYRRPRQRRTTVMVRISERYCDEVLWPEFLELNQVLVGYLNDVADRVIGEVLQADRSDAGVVDEPSALAG